jgi:hypothetical protein
MKRTTINLLLLMLLVIGITACTGASNPEVVEPETADTVATEITSASPEPVEEATVVAIETPEEEIEVEAGTPAPNETIVVSETPTIESTPEPQATEEGEMADGIIMVFRRDGGIAGFCDTLTVRVETVTLESCNPNFAQGEMPLDPAMQAELLALQEQYSTFTTSQTDAPGAADAMTYTVEFNGTGVQAFTPDVEQQVMMIGQELLDTFASQS